MAPPRVAVASSRSTKLFVWGASFTVPDSPVDSSSAVKAVPSGSLRELAHEMPGFSTPMQAPKISRTYSMSEPPQAEAARRVVPIVSHKQKQVSQPTSRDAQIRSSHNSTDRSKPGTSKAGVKVDVIGDGRFSGSFHRDISAVLLSQPRSPRVYSMVF